MWTSVRRAYSARVKWLALVLLATGIVSVTPSAQAADPLADHRPCVANREANGTLAGYTRARLERKWEVVGKGADYEVPTQGWMVIYPWCDHPYPGSDGSDMSLAWVAVKFHGKRDRYTGDMVEYSCTMDAEGCPAP
jgi:hypothetical protein